MFRSIGTLLVGSILVAPSTTQVFAKANPPQNHQSSCQGQVVNKHRLIDKDYRFTLTRPGPYWRIMAEKDAHQNGLDSLAGMSALGGTLRGVSMSIAAEWAPGTGLVAFADSVFDSLTLDNKELRSNRQMNFLGVQARTFVIRGKLNGQQYRYAYVVFLRQRFAFQVLLHGPDKTMRHANAIATMVKLLRLDPGKIRSRGYRAPIEDKHGITWQVKDEVYSSLRGGYRVKAAKNWRLWSGDELHRRQPNADVGLRNVRDNIYLISIVESCRANGAHHVAWSKKATDVKGRTQDTHQSTSAREG